MISKKVIFMDTWLRNKESTKQEKNEIYMLEKKYFKLRLENQGIDIQHNSKNMLLYFGLKENLSSDEYEFLVMPEFNSLYLPNIFNSEKILKIFFYYNNEDYIIWLTDENTKLSFNIFNISYDMMQTIDIWDINGRDWYCTFFSQSHKLLCILNLTNQVINIRSDAVDTVWFEIVELHFNNSANEFFIKKDQIFLDLQGNYEWDFDLVDVYSKASLTDTGDLFFLAFKENLVIWLNEK